MTTAMFEELKCPSRKHDLYFIANLIGETEPIKKGNHIELLSPVPYLLGNGVATIYNEEKNSFVTGETITTNDDETINDTIHDETINDTIHDETINDTIHDETKSDTIHDETKSDTITTTTTTIQNDTTITNKQNDINSSPMVDDIPFEFIDHNQEDNVHPSSSCLIQ